MAGFLSAVPTSGVTLQAVRELLPKLMEQGFHFEKVTDILMSYEELTARVRAVIAATQHVPQEKITADSTFQELGIDSLDGINILFAVESEFNINIPDEAAQNLRSVRDVIDGIAKLLWPERRQGNQAAVTTA
jgi:acyl carrier protein